MKIQDLLQLAQNPGPMQGMAKQMLQQIADEQHGTDVRTMRIGMHGSPAAGPDGLNYGDAESGHDSYPEELLHAYADRYGMQPVPPSGDDQTSGGWIPSQKAQDAWTDDMTPSLWDRIKGMAGAVADNPMDSIVNPLHEFAEYATPGWGNMKGSQDFYNHAKALSTSEADPVSNFLEYAPALGQDVMQMLLPAGRGSAERIGDAAYRAYKPTSSALLAQLLRHYQ